jgi:hypothetical protein
MEKEIILNLWYITDESGLIYSLKAKPYVHYGSDELKTNFLKERANLDFEVAKDFYLPENVHVVFPEGSLNLVPVSVLNSDYGINQVFGKVFEGIEKELSVTCNLELPSNPLYVITALYLSEDKKVSLLTP